MYKLAISTSGEYVSAAIFEDKLLASFVSKTNRGSTGILLNQINELFGKKYIAEVAKESVQSTQETQQEIVKSQSNVISIDAVKAARACGLAIISQLREATNSNLDSISKIIKLGGFVNCVDNFTKQPEIINGASDLIVAVFGDAGMHTRAAVSTNSLPLGVSVEVDAIFELN